MGSPKRHNATGRLSFQNGYSNASGNTMTPAAMRARLNSHRPVPDVGERAFGGEPENIGGIGQDAFALNHERHASPRAIKVDPKGSEPFENRITLERLRFHGAEAAPPGKQRVADQHEQERIPP